MQCQHNILLAKLPVSTGIMVDMSECLNGVCGMFTFKKYICSDCKCTITVLEAVVSKEENGPVSFLDTQEIPGDRDL